MRTRQQFIDTYTESHRNSLNQRIHIVCVPLIFFTTAGLAWKVPLGRLLPFLSDAAAPWLNLTTLGLIPIMLFYARLGWRSLATGALWAAASIAGIYAIESAGLPLLWICLTIWIAAWIVQIYGHQVEGAKPSFIDDILFLLIGPLFVWDKLRGFLQTGSIHAAKP